MARVKQKVPLQREPSGLTQELPDSPGPGWKKHRGNAKTDGGLKSALAEVTAADQAGLTQLIICVGGIYASFLCWALLQERITTTTYGSPKSPSKFTYAVFLNTVQSSFAALTGYLYLLYSNKGGRTPSVFPNSRIVGPLVLVSITSSLASPFGYAALAHIDYITFILAKSCKLLPVMFLHITIFRKKYPLYKYAVIGLVTTGVAVFTLHQPSSKKASNNPMGNRTWGLFLLGVNLLLDGLTNSTQDQIFTTFRPYSGPQMMVAQNMLSTLITASYLLLLPYLAQTPLYDTLSLPASAATELASALSFLQTHPAVLKDVLGFAACGAVGQIFIYYTLSKFSSLLLVTVTVTRKMVTMMLSVLWFGHRLSGMQWVGVGLVFGGVGAEGVIARREKSAKEREKARKEL